MSPEGTPAARAARLSASLGPPLEASSKSLDGVVDMSSSSSSSSKEPEVMPAEEVKELEIAEPDDLPPTEVPDVAWSMSWAACDGEGGGGGHYYLDPAALPPSRAYTMYWLEGGRYGWGGGIGNIPQPQRLNG